MTIGSYASAMLAGPSGLVVLGGDARGRADRGGSCGALRFSGASPDRRLLRHGDTGAQHRDPPDHPGDPRLHRRQHGRGGHGRHPTARPDTAALRRRHDRVHGQDVLLLPGLAARTRRRRNRVLDRPLAHGRGPARGPPERNPGAERRRRQRDLQAHRLRHRLLLRRDRGQLLRALSDPGPSRCVLALGPRSTRSLTL